MARLAAPTACVATSFRVGGEGVKFLSLSIASGRRRANPCAQGEVKLRLKNGWGVLTPSLGVGMGERRRTAPTMIERGGHAINQVRVA